MIIPIVKKFINSTMGTSNAKPLNDMVSDVTSNVNTKFQSLFEDLREIIVRGKQTVEPRHYIQSGRGGNIAYTATGLRIPLTTTIKSNNTYIRNVSNVSAIIVVKLRDGSLFEINPATYIDSTNDEIVMYIADNDGNYLRDSDNYSWVLCYTVEQLVNSY